MCLEGFVCISILHLFCLNVFSMFFDARAQAAPDHRVSDHTPPTTPTHLVKSLGNKPSNNRLPFLGTRFDEVGPIDSYNVYSYF